MSERWNVLRRATAVVAVALVASGVIGSATSVSWAGKFLTKSQASRMFLTPGQAENLFPKIGQGWFMPSWVDYEIFTDTAQVPPYDTAQGSPGVGYAEAICPDGWAAVSGGYRFDSRPAFPNTLQVTAEYPSSGTGTTDPGTRAWLVEVSNWDEDSSWSVSATVICWKPDTID